MSDFEAKYATLPLAELAQAQLNLKHEIEALGAAKTALQKEFDYISKGKLPSLMESMGIESVKIEGVGRISIRADMQCTVKAEHKYDLQEWLRENDFGDLISEVVNASTLKAFVKEQMKAGNPIPEEYLSIHLFEQASITKA